MDTTSFKSVLSNVKKYQEISNECMQDTTTSTLHSNNADVIDSFHRPHVKERNSMSNSKKRTFDSVDKTILVSTTQTGNPLLNVFVNVNWRYVKNTTESSISYDYQVRGRNIIFLSLKYHKLHPEYINKRIQSLNKSKSNILLCVVDIDNSEDILRYVNKICMFNDFTLLLAFTFDQAGKYLMFMNK